ncbi:MAG TPA: hypothetical protein VHW02_14000 [Rhizomicrobium sp.]|jgi:hypothetical protein|nr:hypothetical protein [Rhizomicrobium sp.]
MSANPPTAQPARRDFFAWVCMAVHIGVMVFVVLGWLTPYTPVLIFYALLLPAMAAQWRFNKGSCVLNNFESWVRTGTWRSQANPEEGQWLKMLAADALGLKLTDGQVSLITYGLMLIFWLLAAGHWLFWYGPLSRS